MSSRTFRAALSALVISASLVAGSVGTAAGVIPRAPLSSDQLRTDLPRVLDGEVLAVHEAGGRLYVGGNFTIVEVDGVGRTIGNFFAVDLSTGDLLAGFAHDVDDEVRAIELSANGLDLYLGGTFKTVNGVTRKRIVKMDALTGAVDTGFKANAAAAVDDLALSNGRLYAGGAFSKVNGVARTRLAAVDAATGALDPGFDFVFSGPVGGRGNGKSVRALDVNPAGTRLLVVHLNRLIDGQVRTGVAMIDISGPTATLSPWSTMLYEQNRCVFGGVWVRDGKFSPDGSYFVVVGSGHDYPPVCDSATRFATTDTPGATYEWTSRHMDTLESVAVDDTTVYVGGHFRFQESPYAPEPWPGTSPTPAGGIRQAKSGDFGGHVVKRFQLGAIDPATGHALPWSISANGFRGVLDLEITRRGLMVGMDVPRNGSPPKMGGEPVGAFGVIDRGPVVADTRAPSVSALSALGGETAVRLAWSATDNDVLHGVKIFRDGIHIATTHESAFVDGSATGAHAYRVVAYDRSGNSASSGTITVGLSAEAAVNAALAGAANQSSTEFGAAASRAIDGNTNGRFGDGSVTHTETQRQPWWDVDLGSIRLIDRVVLWNRTDCCGNRLRDLSVMVSDTPFTSDGYYSNRKKAGVTVFELDNVLPPSFEVPTAVTGRYVRVHLKTSSGILSLAEVQVFAQPVPEIDAALLVVGDPASLTTGDSAILGRLQGAGLTVNVIDAAALTAINPNAHRLVWVATTASATGAQSAVLRDTTAPVVISKPYLLDNLDLTGPEAKVDFGATSSTTLDIVDAAHPLAASLTGAVVVVDQSRRLTWGVPSADAAVVATVEGAPALFAYDIGDSLADASPAPGCRVVFPADKVSPADHTVEGWALFDATVAYVDGAACD